MALPLLVLIVLAVAAVAVGAAPLLVVRRVLRRRLPRVRGRLLVEGLGAPATVVRDRYGGVHVDAATMEDAALAMGLVHAQERLWQLDLHRRTARGRLSEIAGAPALAADRFVRRVGLARIAEQEEALLPPEPRRLLEAYAAGVNAGIDQMRALPLEFSLLKLRPQRWCPADSIAVVKLLALGLSLNWDAELQRVRLLQAVGPERAARLDTPYPHDNPTILAQTLAGTTGGDALELFREAARWLPAAGGGSNAWVLAPSRTQCARPLLCNDPHLAPTVPSPWFLAHVRVVGDFETTGVTLAGQPFPVIGHNRSVAWGFTNSMADAQDLVVEHLDGPQGARHRTETGWAETTLVREVIRVKDASDAVEEVLVTRHGPIVERLRHQDGEGWLGLALQWTALTPGCATASLLALQRAADWDSFRRAFAALDAPSQNVVYADADGHIGYFCSGRIPVRRRPASGLPVPGWNGDAAWERFLDLDEVPQLLDPDGGLVITANNRIVGDAFPHHIAADYLSGYRARRISEVIGDRAGLSAEAMRQLQLDIESIPAREAISQLRRIACRDREAEQARRRLISWDARMAGRASQPALFELFLLHLAEQALRPLAGDAWAIAAGVDLEHPLSGYPGNLAGRVTGLLLERWRSDDTSLLDGGSWGDVAERALAAAAADLRRRGRRPTWERLHRLVLEHPLAVRRSLRPLLNAPAIAVGGSTDTVMATGHRPGGDLRTRLFAPSWRQVLEVGAWDRGCTGIHYPGQSGHRASRHHHDLSRRWVRNQQLPMRWGDAAFRGRRRLTLLPRTTLPGGAS